MDAFCDLLISWIYAFVYAFSMMNCSVICPSCPLKITINSKISFSLISLTPSLTLSNNTNLYQILSRLGLL